MKLCLVCNFQTTEEQETCPRDGSSMVTVGDDPLLGEVVEGRYKIQSVIGQGSAGTVYKAVQELIGREVAIKVLHDYLVSDEEFIKRFRQEAKASSRLSHPNIITIYDFGVIPQGNRPYIAMDLLIGTPLSDLLAQEERLPFKEALPIFTQVASALGEAHREGVVHRDVKPENIVLVERSGQKLFPMMVDFGIARIVEESDAAKITRTGTVCGSPTYMSPEQCTSSKVDNRSDIYSLAVVCYETLTGEVPFHSEELVRVMAMHLSDPPTPLNEVKPGLRFPDELEEVINKAMAKSPDQRYQTMDEFAEALEEAGKASVQPINKPTTQNLKQPDIEPGPLAQADSLQPKHNTGEMAIGKSSTIDFAATAMQEMNTTGENALSADASGIRKAPHQDTPADPLDVSVQDQVASMLSQKKQDQKDALKGQGLQSADFSRGRGGNSPVVHIQRFIPLLIGIIAIVGVIYLIQSTPGFDVTSYFPKTKAVDKTPKQVALEQVDAGEFEKAIPVLEELEKKGDLTKNDLDKLASAYLNQAKKLHEDKKNDQAIALLNKIDKDCAVYNDGQKLVKEYSKKQKKKNNKRRRRRRR